MSAPLPSCLAPTSPSTSVAPPLPIIGERPVDGALLADVGILLAVIALLYLAFRAISKHPWIPTSISLAALFYLGVDVRWWNTRSVTADDQGITLSPWVGADTRLAWAAIDTLACRDGNLFPIVQDDARVVVSGKGASGDILEIEISRFLDRFDDLAAVLARRVQPRPAPTSP